MQRQSGAGTETNEGVAPRQSGAGLERKAAQSPVGVEELEILAGFLAWLARQDIPARRRDEYCRPIESYLGWRAGQQTRSPTAREFLLVAGGRRENTRRLRASFALLRRYLLAASYRRTGSRNSLWSRLSAELVR